MSELSTWDPATTELEKQQYEKFDDFNTLNVSPRTDTYQQTNVFEGFDMREVVAQSYEAFGLPAEHVLYLVVFRSQRINGLTGTDIDQLTQQDHLAHAEANARLDEQDRRSLLHYFKGLPDSSGFCMSWCIWSDEAIAKLASGDRARGKESQSPEHDKAKRLARLMYQRYGIQTYRLKLAGEDLDIENAKDTWTPQLAAADRQNTLETVQTGNRRTDVGIQRAIGAIGI